MFKKFFILILLFLTIGGAVFYFSLRSKKISEIKAAPVTSGIVGWWKLDEQSWDGTAGEVKDMLKNNNGTSSNGANANTTDMAKFGRAGTFNGFGYVSAGTTGLPIGGSNRTISVWFKAASLESSYGQSIFGYGSNSGGQRVGIHLVDILGVRSLQFEFCLAAAQFSWEGDYNWHHFVGIINGPTAGDSEIYFDGVKQAVTFSNPTSLINTGTSELIIGRMAGYDSYYYDGIVDDARIYNRALSAQEVTNLYKYGSSTLNIVNAPTKTASSTVGSLVGYWTMDAGDTYYNATASTTLDKSGYNNNGTLTGTTTSTGVMKEARKFNGSSDVVSVERKSILDITQQITMSAWIKPSVTTGLITILDKDQTFNGYNLHINNGQLHARVDNAGNMDDTNFAEGGTIISNQWNFVSATYDPVNKINAYINGVLVATSPTAPDSIGIADKKLYIGAFLDTEFNRWERWFTGSIDDVRVYNYAMSAHEVMDLYNAAKSMHINAPTKSGLVGYWTMDIGDRTGKYILDRSGNNNIGALVGNTTSTGVMKQGLSFNGTSNYVTTGTKNTLHVASAPFSLAAWIKTPSTLSGTDDRTIMADSESDGSGYIFVLNRSACAASNIDLAKSGVADQCVAYKFLTNKWYHVVAVQNSANVMYYVDGAYIGLYSNASSYNSAAGKIFSIGKGYSPVNPWSGLMDEVRVYNRALSAQEVMNLYNSSRRSYK